MDDALRHLVGLHPPLAPRHVGVEEWAGIEMELGTGLPRDYKTLLATYTGTAPFFGWFDFLRPEGRLEAIEGTTYLRCLRDDLLEDERVYARQAGKVVADVRSPIPFPVFPEDGGLFQWGSMPDWVTFHWWQLGPPDTWGVVVAYKWIEEFHHFPGRTTTQILAEIAERGFNGFGTIERMGGRPRNFS
ncbi:hypothetical protein J0H58_36345 [bacterium]|nr:hypothetical protein [bacterium]